MRAPKIALALVPIALLAAACSSTVSTSQATVESEIATAYAEASGASVDDLTVTCPGDLEGTIGKTMVCVVVVGDVSQEFVVTVTSVTDSEVRFSLEDAETAAAPSATPSATS